MESGSLGLTSNPESIFYRIVWGSFLNLPDLQFPDLKLGAKHLLREMQPEQRDPADSVQDSARQEEAWE